MSPRMVDLTRPPSRRGLFAPAYSPAPQPIRIVAVPHTLPSIVNNLELSLKFQVSNLVWGKSGDQGRVGGCWGLESKLKCPEKDVLLKIENRITTRKMTRQLRAVNIPTCVNQTQLNLVMEKLLQLQVMITI